MEAAETPLSSPQQQPHDDRISELPDCLLHHILSFIDTRTVIQTSFLSRRWRYVWNALPVLNFNYDLYPEERYGDDNRSREQLTFETFVNRLFYLYMLRKFTSLQRLSLDYNKWSDLRGARTLVTWIQLAVMNNVVEFDLHAPRSTIELPPTLFSCTTLTKLRLVTGGTVFSFDDGSAANLPLLKTLHLQGIKIKLGTNGNTATCTFLGRCPVLETLVISNCASWMYYNPGNAGESLLHICSSQLKNLEIINLKGFAGCQISAPKLVSFKVIDRLGSEYSFVETSSLVKATVLYDEPISGGRPPDAFRWHQYEQERYREEEANEPKKLIKCLNGINNVKSLTLSTKFFKVIKVPECLENELSQFWDLRFLRLSHIYLSGSHTFAIPYLLEKCPNVQTLSLEMALDKVKTRDKSWVQLSECPELNHLKFLEIRNVVGCENDLEVLEFFMKSAKMLETVHIFTFKESKPGDRYCSRKNMKRKRMKMETFSNALKNFSLSYSTVEMLLLQGMESEPRQERAAPTSLYDGYESPYGYESSSAASSD